MNKKLKEFSDKYNAEKIIRANCDSLIYFLDHKGEPIKLLLKTANDYNLFIKIMSEEIEEYQRWMYLEAYKRGFREAKFKRKEAGDSSQD